MRLFQKIKKIGALTSKPYSFKSRSWELKYLESIDLNDTLGSNIKIDYKNSQILRILPNINENINEEWISDKIRFSYDSLNRWRFNTPLMKKNDLFVPCSWKESFNVINKFLTKFPVHNTTIVAGNYNSLETLSAMKYLSFKIPQSQLKLNGFKNGLNNDNFSTSLLKLKNNYKHQKVFIFVGSNLRLESPILNLKFRKLSKKQNVLIGYIGSAYNATSYMHHIGNNTQSIVKILTGRDQFCFLLKKFLFHSTNKKQKLSFLFGLDYQTRFDSNNIQNIINKFKKNKIFKSIETCFLREYPSELNNEIINFESLKKPNSSKNQINYFFGTDDYIIKTNKNLLNIFIGHHNYKLRKKMSLILPSTTYLEDSGTYLNILNILQKTKGLNSIFKHVRSELLIIQMISKHLYAFDLQQIIKKNIKALIGKRSLNEKVKFSFRLPSSKFLYYNNINYNSCFKNTKSNFYTSDALIQSSKTMQKCSNSFFFNKYSYTWN